MKYQDKRIKFGLFHLYRTPFALGSSLDELVGGQSPKRTCKFGEYQVTWGEWRKKIKALCPLQFWLREDFPYYFSRTWRRIKGKWYELKCFFSPYNVIKINTLPKTWSDEDSLLIHSMFAILERFMSQKPEERHDYTWETVERPDGYTDEEWNKIKEPHQRFWREINEVWDWWLKREEREGALSDALSVCTKRGRGNYNEKYKELIALEVQFEQEEEEMLIKLVKNRHNLWT